jgi:hypothetical protein
MAAEPARGMLGENIGADKFVQDSLSHCWRAACQAGHGADREIRTRVQTGQPEQSCRRWPHVLVGPGEHRPDRSAVITGGIEQVQLLLLACELTGQVGKGDSWAGSGKLGGYTQRQRQPSATVSQRPCRPWVFVSSLSYQRSQQCDRIVEWEEVQGQARGTVPGDQTSQCVTAGYQRHAGRSAGQQWPDLLRVAGIVQDHQNPPPAQQASVLGRALALFHWDVPVRYTERAQEPRQRIGR